MSLVSAQKSHIRSSLMAASELSERSYSALQAITHRILFEVDIRPQETLIQTLYGTEVIAQRSFGKVTVALHYLPQRVHLSQSWSDMSQALHNCSYVLSRDREWPVHDDPRHRLIAAGHRHGSLVRDEAGILANQSPY